MAADPAREPLAVRRPTAPKMDPALNRANIVDEADKENSEALAKKTILRDRRKKEENTEREAQLAAREQAVAQREKQAQEQSLAVEEKISDLEMMEIRIKERKRALNAREAAQRDAAAQEGEPRSGALPNEKALENIGMDQQREAKLAARESQLAQAEASCTSREQNLTKREEAQRRAERQMRVQETTLTSTGDTRSVAAEVKLAMRESSLKQREEAVARAEDIDEREARVTRLESALAERQRAVGVEAKGIAAQSKAMAERSREINSRETALAERQRQQDARATQLARESARLSSEASRLATERLALQGEAAEMEARRRSFEAAYVAQASTVRQSAARMPVNLEDAEPTWHSVADDSERSQTVLSDSEDDSHQQGAPAARRGAVRGSLDGLLSLAELTGEGPLARASAKSVRFVPETPRSAAASGHETSRSSGSSSYPRSISGGGFNSKSFSSQTGNCASERGGSQLRAKPQSACDLKGTAPNPEAGTLCAAALRSHSALTPDVMVESDRVSIASSTGGKRHLTARKGIGRSSSASSSGGVGGGSGNPLGGRQTPDATHFAARPSSGRMPPPEQETQGKASGLFSALRRSLSLGGA